MSVSTYVYLPGNVRIRDVAMVLAKLHGEELAPLGDSWSLPKSVEIHTHTGMPETAIIAGPSWQAFFHFEPTENPAGRLVSFGYSEHRLKVAIGLSEFFGGYVKADPSEDEILASYIEKGDRVNAPQSNTDWARMQKRLAAVKEV